MRNDQAARPRGPRSRASSVLRGCAQVMVIAGTALFTTTVIFRDDRLGQIVWIDVGVYQVVYLGAAILLLTAPAADRRVRRGWRWLGVAVLAYAAANVVFSLVTQHSATPDAPSVADLLYLAWYPLTYVGVVQLVRARLRRPTAAEAVDGVIVAGGAGALAVASVLGGLLTFEGTPTFEVLVNLAYPVGDLLLLLIVVTGGFVVGRTATRSGVMLAGGLLATAFGDLVYLQQAAADSYVEGGWTDTLWLLGVALIGAASCIAGARPVNTPRDTAPTASLVSTAGFAAAAVVVLALEQLRLVAWQAAIPADLAVTAAVLRAALTVRELRRSKAHEVAELDRLAHTDELTDLPNRRAVRERCQTLLRSGSAAEAGVCLLVLDVDRFKDVNDSLSHSVGDRLLRQLGERLRGALDATDYLARLGGDEFAVLLTGDDADGRQRAEAIHEVLAEPFLLGGLRLHVDVSVGIAATTSATTDPGDLLGLADDAMYRAKRGHSRIGVHERADDRTLDRLHRTEQLRAALAGEDPDTNGRLIVHVQPQVALGPAPPDGGSRPATVGAEALVRWLHPVDGLRAPDSFLPLADHAGLLPALADVVLDAALDACRAWWCAGHEIPVSVNLSAGDVLDTGLVDRVASALRRHGLPASAVVLELTEETLLVDPAAARTVLDALRRSGVTLSIDDYGSGYSSLAYLRELPVHELKLDRAFVVDLAANPLPTSRSAAIVRTTADLAHSLGLRLVAEGIEDGDTLRLLGLLGCDVGQGYHIARPMPADQLTAWLARPADGPSVPWPSSGRHDDLRPARPRR